VKLVELLAIPVGFALVRSLTKSIEDEPAAKPILPKDKGFTLGPKGGSMDIAPLFPDGFFFSLPGLGGTKPTTPRIKHTGPTTKFGVGTDVVPFFPKGAGDPSLLKPVAGLAGLKDIPKIDISKIKPNAFTTGLFDPGVQERLKTFKPVVPK